MDDDTYYLDDQDGPNYEPQPIGVVWLIADDEDWGTECNRCNIVLVEALNEF